MSDETEFITYQQWDRCAKRIEKRNFDKYGRSLSYSGIANILSGRNKGWIIELRSGSDDEHGIMVVRKGWREAMREATEKWMREQFPELFALSK